MLLDFIINGLNEVVTLVAIYKSLLLKEFPLYISYRTRGVGMSWYTSISRVFSYRYDNYFLKLCELYQLLLTSKGDLFILRQNKSGSISRMKWYQICQMSNALPIATGNLNNSFSVGDEVLFCFTVYHLFISFKYLCIFFHYE